MGIRANGIGWFIWLACRTQSTSCTASQRTRQKQRDMTYQQPRNAGKVCSKDCERSKGMKKKSKEETPHLTRGNVLDDLGFSPAEALELKVKSDIYYELLEYIKEQRFTQQELGALLGIHQPDVSYLMNGRVSKFSVGKLIKFAGKLNLGTEVKITRPKFGKSSTAASRKPRKRISVLA